MTHKHGVNDESGGGYASLGLMAKAILGDFVTAASFAEKALLLQQRAQTKYTAPTALFSAYNFVFSWTNPLQSCLNPFLEGFASGMRSGNIDFSMWCLLAHHVQMPYQMGKPLSLILSRCPDCVHQMEELRQQDHCLMLNLAGQSKETTRLKGELFACDEFVAKTPLQTAAVNLAKLELLVYYGDFDSAAKHAIKCSDSFDKTTNGMFLSMMETFHRGVALYAMARRTKKRKYRKRAIRVRSTIAKWVQNGNPNVKHYHSLLNAEQAALDREYHEAEALYKEAIILAARPGYLHDAALFNERYADFLRKEGHHFALAEDEIVYRIEEAIRYYKEWGAKAKVEMLQAEHGRLLH
jgi:tetratricopeptide (TPR) repeat protein